MDVPGFSVEAQIRAAQARGDFDDLPGAGKPLHLPDVHDPDWWIKAKMQREHLDASALLHPTLALRREAEGLPESLTDVDSEDAVRELLLDFNERVKAEWRRPASGPSLPVVARLVNVEAMVARWSVLSAERRALTEQAVRESSRVAPSAGDAANARGARTRTKLGLRLRRRLARLVPPRQGR
jgi:hypothetical protein